MRRKPRWRARIRDFLQRPDVILFAIVGVTILVGAAWALSFRSEPGVAEPTMALADASEAGVFEKRSTSVVRPAAPAATRASARSARRLPRLASIWPAVRRAVRAPKPAPIPSLASNPAPAPRPAQEDSRAPKRLEGSFGFAQIRFTSR